MSQPSTERETRPRPGGRGQGKGLSRKIGPLPAWGWAAVAGGAALIWVVIKRGKKSQQAASAPSSGGACTDASGQPGTLDSAGNCVPSAVIFQGGSAGAAPGTMCKDAAGNPGFVNANGDCDTSLSGTGLPGGGQDAALLAQIKALQGQESTEQKTIADIQSDVGEPKPPPKVVPPPMEPCPRGFRRVNGRCVPIPRPKEPVEIPGGPVRRLGPGLRGR